MTNAEWRMEGITDFQLPIADWSKRQSGGRTTGVDLACGGFVLAFRPMLIFRNAFVHRDLWISRWVRFVRALSLGIEALRHKAARGAGAAFIYTYNLTGDRWGPCDRAITGRQLRVTSYKLRVTNVETQKRRKRTSVEAIRRRRTMLRHEAEGGGLSDGGGRGPPFVTSPRTTTAD